MLLKKSSASINHDSNLFQGDRMSKGNDKNKHKLTIKEKQDRKKEKQKNKQDTDAMETVKGR
jgi:hypothetical protein